MKQCPRCAKQGFGPKPESEFSVDKANPSGLQALCKECKQARFKVWLTLNKENNKDRNVAWHSAHPGKAAIKKSLWAAASAKRDKEQPARRAARQAKRRASQSQRTPLWADLRKIARVYDEARRMTLLMGEPWHVDHIIPLRGKRVSGLHVHGNLQVLLGIENEKKNNRFQIEFQEEPRDLERAA